MDSYKVQAIKHTSARFCSPLNGTLVEHLIDMLQVVPGMRVLDLGCAERGALIGIAAFPARDSQFGRTVLFRQCDRVDLCRSADVSPQEAQHFGMRLKGVDGARMPAQDVAVDPLVRTDIEGEARGIAEKRDQMKFRLALAQIAPDNIGKVKSARQQQFEPFR